MEWKLRVPGVSESGVRSVQVAVAPSYSHTSLTRLGPATYPPASRSRRRSGWYVITAQARGAGAAEAGAIFVQAVPFHSQRSLSRAEPVAAAVPPKSTVRPRLSS